MGDQLDNRPVFTFVMGCDGAGKTAWRRENHDRLPERYFDADWIADGIGDWNSESTRAEAREFVDQAVSEAIAARVNFGIEDGLAMVERAKQAGYRIEGVYIGTDSPEINAERVEHRIASRTGHSVDVTRLPERYRESLASLRKTAEQFDELEIVDNSEHNADRRPWPVEQLWLEKGVVRSRSKTLRPWCENWLGGK